MSDEIGLILLAAGGSSRMGRPKQLLKFPGLGRTLLVVAAERAVKAGCHPVVVVLGAEVELCRKELAGMDVSIVVNEDWQKGMGTSIRAGMGEVLKATPELRGVVLMLCDQPGVDVGAIEKLVGMFLGGKELVAVRYGDSIGVPAVFGRGYFAELQALPDEKGAKGILMRNRGSVGVVEIPAAGFDIDTPEDYSRLA